MKGKIKFESALIRLEEIVHKLEEGVDELDKIVDLFEEGSELSEIVWDGTFNGQIVQDGAYTYKFTIWPINYNNGELSAFEYPGHVMVLR